MQGVISSLETYLIALGKGTLVASLISYVKVNVCARGCFPKVQDR